MAKAKTTTKTEISADRVLKLYVVPNEIADQIAKTMADVFYDESGMDDKKLGWKIIDAENGGKYICAVYTAGIGISVFQTDKLRSFIRGYLTGYNDKK